MAIKFKPAVKNELILKDVLTLHLLEDVGADLRVVVQYGDMVKMTVVNPPTDEYKEIHLLITEDQMNQLVTLWNEWKEIEDGHPDSDC